MESRINQLVEMGATRAQAKAALTRYKDVDQAAEKIFEGHFDDVADDGWPSTEVEASESGPSKSRANESSEQDMDEEADGNDDEDDVEDFGGYDSEEDDRPTLKLGNVDPYAGIFFSKDRREEVIEIDDDPIMTFIPSIGRELELLSQSELMKGCPEKGEQGFLFGLYQKLSSEECPCPSGCGEIVHRKGTDFFPIFPDFASYTKHLRKIVPRVCKRCSKTFCLACGDSTHQDPKDKASRPSANGNVPHDPLFHCSDLQGVTLGMGLYMVDRLFEQQSGRLQLETPLAKKRKVSHTDNDLDADVLVYGGKRGGKTAPGGTGYAGAQREDLAWQSAAQASQQTKDQVMSTLFRQVREFLPSLHREGGACSSDFLVHPTTLAHLRRRFNRVCSVLLRNDSLLDMSDRSILYYELFEWLSTVSSHETLASMMAMPIMVVHTRTPKANCPPASKSHEMSVLYEGSAGPRELLDSIYIQAQAAIKGLEASAPPKEESEQTEMTENEKRMAHSEKGKEKAVSIHSEENHRLMSFCQRILETRSAIDRSLMETKGEVFVQRLINPLPKIPGSREAKAEAVISLKTTSTEVETHKAYVEWATRVRFEYCDLSLPPDTQDADGKNNETKWKFYFNGDAQALSQTDLPRRSLAIAKELAVLTTNLPVAWDSSIFLRVDETRVDIIKALIIGPEGTPYQNGCYLFDIFLGATYNQSPPNVKYMTTNGGKYRFNPNLYADGKVCLSLLGTWSGPGWVAGKSTLLQVLVSIQSMIFCEEPYLNEPGWANGAGTSASKQYSCNVRRMVIHTAMLSALKNPPEPFEDIIRTHFKLKAKSLIKQLDEWQKADVDVVTANIGQMGGETTKAGAKKNVEELKSLLKELQKEQFRPL